VRPGQRIVLRGSGYRPGSTVRLVLFSDPIELGSIAADSDGVFAADLEIPEEAPSGDHAVVAIGVDADGADRVLSLGVSLDRDGPAIESIAVSSPTVRPGDTFTITIRATDPSGVRSVGFYLSVGGMQRDFCGQQMTRTGGTTTDAIWTHDCLVPANIIGGEYTITPFAEDELGNYTNMNQGSSSPLRGTFTVV